MAGTLTQLNAMPATSRCRIRVVVAAAVAVIAAAISLFASADVIPVETLFRKPQYGGATLSPSGRYLAVLAMVKNRRAVAVLDLDANTIKTMTVAYGNGDALSVVWLTDDRMIVRIGDIDRASGERPNIIGEWAVNRDGSDDRRVPGSFFRTFPGSNDVLLTETRRSEYSLDLYKWGTYAGYGEMTTFDSPGNVWRWVTDFDGVARATVTDDLRHDKAAWYVRKDANSPWQEVDHAAFNDLTSAPVQFSPDGKTLYVDATRKEDRSAIYAYAVDSGTWSGPVIKHPQRDIVGHFIVDLANRKLLGFEYADDRPSIVWFDKDWAKMQASVDAALPATLNGLQHRGERWIVTATSDRNPGDVYLLDGKSMKMSKLFSYEPWIDPASMAGTRWVRYPSRDGLSIPAMLTLPISGTKPYPLIVDIHGGPNVDAGSNVYDPEVQFFASRGYAVLRPQYRGTHGFGTAFFKAGFRQWGDAMQDDLEDGVKWAAAQGIADPGRVCFYGASYGGYAAIWETIRNPKLIRCAVALAAPTSIDYLFDNAQTDMAYVAEKSSEMATQIGDPSTERARFKRVSPLQHADAVDAPLMLAYGLSDQRVPFVHGSDFKSALDSHGKTYDWVTYSGEAHGLTLDANVFDYYNRVDHFLSKYLHAKPVPASPAS